PDVPNGGGSTSGGGWMDTPAVGASGSGEGSGRKCGASSISVVAASPAATASTCSGSLATSDGSSGWGTSCSSGIATPPTGSAGGSPSSATSSGAGPSGASSAGTSP